jgi:hypothetical protein
MTASRLKFHHADQTPGYPMKMGILRHVAEFLGKRPPWKMGWVPMKGRC